MHFFKMVGYKLKDISKMPSNYKGLPSGLVSISSQTKPIYYVDAAVKA